jgi:hypothetical protein
LQEASILARLVKLRQETYDRVKQLSQDYQISMQEVVARSVVALEKQEFARAFQEDFAVLRADAHAWEEEQAERELLDGTLEDGLE